jgi:hypothetical protein
MVGSEETEPCAGRPYNAVLKKLSEQPNTIPADWVKIIAQYYENFLYSR